MFLLPFATPQAIVAWLPAMATVGGGLGLAASYLRRSRWLAVVIPPLAWTGAIVAASVAFSTGRVPRGEEFAIVTALAFLIGLVLLSIAFLIERHIRTGSDS